MVQDSSQRHRLKALVSRQDQLIVVEVKYETGEIKKELPKLHWKNFQY